MIQSSWLMSCIVVALLVLCVQVALGQQEANCTLQPSCSNFTNIGECNIITGNCSCNETELDACFRLEESLCVLNSPCWQYMEAEGECRNGRRSRTVAILLSVFLINFGAANFYIERYEFAVPQIILGLILCFFQFGSCAVAGTRDETTTAPCIICCSINSFISLLFLAWWIADVTIFALGQRTDGSGCPLY